MIITAGRERLRKRGFPDLHDTRESRRIMYDHQEVT